LRPVFTERSESFGRALYAKPAPSRVASVQTRPLPSGLRAFGEWCQRSGGSASSVRGKMELWSLEGARGDFSPHEGVRNIRKLFSLRLWRRRGVLVVLLVLGVGCIWLCV